MMLTADQILKENLLKLDNTKGKPAQVGYDLSVKALARIVYPGMVLCDRTIVPTYQAVELTSLATSDGYEFDGYYLTPGAYDITFHEGCKIPPNRTAKIRQRSSLLRSGAIIASSIFDPGFETDNIGTVLLVHHIIYIEKDARCAQIYFQTNDSVDQDKLYSGQFQRDAQRNSK